MKRYRMTVKPITAVHVGSGDAITPLEYSIRKNKAGKDIFLRFHPELVVQGLSPQLKSEFSRIADRKDYLRLRSFLDEHASVTSAWYTAAITTRFLKEYLQRRDDEKNSLEIEEDYRAPGQMGPVIPGSSIKGAIRTAVINARMLQKDAKGSKYFDEGFDRSGMKFQNWALDSSRPNDDPFRSLSISDCAFEPRNTQLVGTLHQYTPSSRTGLLFNSIAIYAEMVSGLLTGQETQGQADFTIKDELADFRIPDSKALGSRRGQKLFAKPIALDEILDASDQYYNRAFDYEYDEFYNKSPDVAVFGSGTRIAEHIDTLKGKGEHLVRIGRWSHVESVTVEPPYRKPLGRRGYGKTRTFLDYQGAWFSMGWCSFSLEEF